MTVVVEYAGRHRSPRVTVVRRAEKAGLENTREYVVLGIDSEVHDPVSGGLCDSGLELLPRRTRVDRPINPGEIRSQEQVSAGVHGHVLDPHVLFQALVPFRPGPAVVNR